MDHVMFHSHTMTHISSPHAGLTEYRKHQFKLKADLLTGQTFAKFVDLDYLKFVMLICTVQLWFSLLQKLVLTMALRCLKCTLLPQAFRLAGRPGFLCPKPLAVAPAALFGIYEQDRRSGYKSNAKKLSKKEHYKETMRIMKEEFAKFKDEMRYKFSFDYFYPVRHGDYEVLHKFNKQSEVDKFVVSCDSNHNEGKSQAEFFLNAQEKATFRGFINTDVPKDGVIKRSGFANIKTRPNMVWSFFFKHAVYFYLSYSSRNHFCDGNH
jgi:hypothetical protein